MPFTLVGFYESIQGAGAYIDLNALADQHVTVSGDDIQVPSLNQVVMLAAGLSSTDDTTARRVRLATPSLRERALFQIAPINWQTGAVEPVPQSPHRIIDLTDSPLVLVPREKINAQALCTNAGAQAKWVMVWLADGPIPPIAGPIFTVRCTGGSAAVAGAWTSTALTFEEDLPAGRYQLVGLRPKGTTMIAARCIFVGGGWRPGSLAVNTYYGEQFPAQTVFRYGSMGVYGEFEDLEPPVMEILCNAADAAAVQEFWLDLIQVRKGPA